MSNLKISNIVGYEFTVIAANGRRIILEDENGELYTIEAAPDGMGSQDLEYYRMKAEKYSHA